MAAPYSYEWWIRNLFQSQNLSLFGGATNEVDAFAWAMANYGNDGQFLAALNKILSTNNFGPAWKRIYDQWLMNSVASGDMDPNDAYGNAAASGASIDEEAGKYLDNAIAQQNTEGDRQYQTEMRDTSLTSAGSQLSQLGLSPSNVISVGGASSGVSSAAANQSFAQGSANRKQQLAINQYNQRMGMAKSLISMAGSMASSGIYGSALGAAKHSASALASAASHSGLNLLKHHAGYGNAENYGAMGFMQPMPTGYDFLK